MVAIKSKITVKKELKEPQELICPVCDELNHHWKEVYCQENAQLERVENSYICWCMIAGGHVLYTSSDVGEKTKNSSL